MSSSSSSSRLNPWRDPNFHLVAKSKLTPNQTDESGSNHTINDGVSSNHDHPLYAAVASSSRNSCSGSKPHLGFNVVHKVGEEDDDENEHILLPLCSISPEVEPISVVCHSNPLTHVKTEVDMNDVIDLTEDDDKNIDPLLPAMAETHPPSHPSAASSVKSTPASIAPIPSFLLSASSSSPSSSSSHAASSSSATTSFASSNYAVARQGVELASNIHGVVRVMGGWISFYAKEQVAQQTANESGSIPTRCVCRSNTSSTSSASSSSAAAAAGPRIFTLADLPGSAASCSSSSTSSDSSLCCYCRYRSSNAAALASGTKFECPLDFFLHLYAPESVSSRDAFWISISNSSAVGNVDDEDSMNPEKEEALIEEWERSSVKTADKIRDLAVKYRYTSGKFMVFPMAYFNSMWCQIASAIALHRLEGVRTAKISPARDKQGPTGVVCIYTRNFMDRKELLRIRESLRVNCGMQKKLTYKPDIYTTLGIYSKNPYKITASIGAF